MKLNIGSGHVKGSVFANGWTNVDFAAFEEPKSRWEGAEYLNFTLIEAWPLPRESVDCIFASHILEHIDYPKLMGLFEQAHRVLKTGGPIRIICPDPRNFIQNWRINNHRFLLDSFGEENYKKFSYKDNPHRGFTDMFFPENYSHVIIPTIELFTIMMIRVGFRSVSDLAYTNTQFPQYYGDYNNSIDNRPVMSFYMEGVK